MKQYSDIILYGDASSPEAQQQLADTSNNIIH